MSSAIVHRAAVLGLALGALLTAAFVAPAPVHAADAEDPPQDVRLVVRLRPSPSALAMPGRERAQATLQRSHALAQATANGALAPVKVLSSGAAVLRGTHRMTAAQARALALSLESQDGVLSVEPDVRVQATSNDTYFGSQWTLFGPANGVPGGANVTPAWATTTGSGQVVAVLDTGSTAHPDLQGQWVTGYDFVTDSTVGHDGDGRDADPTDTGDSCNGSASSWHGTAVASTIAALADNAYGIAGVAPGAKIMPVRVLGACGGWLSDTADALYWLSGLAVNGVPPASVTPRVANLSLGGRTSCYQYMQDAVTAASAAGIAVVVAAGNDGSGVLSAPANCSGAIAVAAATASGDLATYSNYGAAVAVTAPGGGNCRLQKGSACSSPLALASGVEGATSLTGYSEVRYLQGTSFAAPNVAGVVALMVATRPSLTPAQIRSALLSSARPSIKGSFCATASRCGGGLLDADRALTFITQGTFAKIAYGSGITVGTAGSEQQGLIGRGKSGSLKGSATGAGALSYSWTQTAGPAATIVGRSNLPSLNFRAPASSGLLQFSLTVSAGNGTSATQTTTVRVNDPPTLPAQLAQGSENAAYSLQLPATDGDGDRLTYALAANTAGWAISDTGELTNAAPKKGTHRVTITVRDPYGQKLQAARSIVVVPVTAAGAPTASLAPPRVPGGTLSMTAGVAYFGTLGVTAAPANGQLRFSTSGLPAGATLSGSGLLSWPSPVVSSTAVTVTVTDAAGRDATGVYTLVVNAAAGSSARRASAATVTADRTLPLRDSPRQAR